MHQSFHSTLSLKTFNANMFKFVNYYRYKTKHLSFICGAFNSKHFTVIFPISGMLQSCEHHEESIFWRHSTSTSSSGIPCCDDVFPQYFPDGFELMEGNFVICKTAPGPPDSRKVSIRGKSDMSSSDSDSVACESGAKSASWSSRAAWLAVKSCSALPAQPVERGGISIVTTTGRLIEKWEIPRAEQSGN